MAGDEVDRTDGGPRVDEVLAQLRAGVRQRQAELATMAEELKDLPPALAYVHRIQYVEEPENTSHRPGIGRLIVFAKGIAYKLSQWYHQAVLRQQNEVNRAVGLALRDLFERQRMLLRELQSQREALDALLAERAERPDEGDA